MTATNALDCLSQRQRCWLARGEALGRRYLALRNWLRSLFRPKAKPKQTHSSHVVRLVCISIGIVLYTTSPTAAAYDYGVNPDPLLELDSYEVNASPEHRLSFFVKAGELETYRAWIRYPDGFVFNGFDVLGPSNTVVGYYDLDLNFDNQPDVSVELRSLTDSSAYADLIPDQEFSPGLEPVLDAQLSELLMTLPYGGDVDDTTLTAPWPAGVTFTLLAGLLSNPEFGGDYTLAAEFISVDPDTDGFNDDQNEAPLRFEIALTVTIDGPTQSVDTPFVQFAVTRGFVFLHPHRDDKDFFWLHGRYTLAADSDGFDISSEDVTVEFANFSQTLAGSDFRRFFKSYYFKSRAPGINYLWLRDNGQFYILASRLDLDLDLSQPVSFTLRLGDDLGETELLFNRHGFYKP